MKSIDKNAEARQLWLRRLQGLSVETTEQHAATRQSDFERSSVWRAVFIAAAVAIGIAAFQPTPTQTEPPATVRTTV